MPPPTGTAPVRMSAVLLTLLAILVTVAIGLGAVRAYTPSPLALTDEEAAAKAVPHLRFLEGALHGGAAEDMQSLFPEGYFFSFALYGLSWTNVGTLDPAQRDEALHRARWALDRLESPEGTGPFPADAEPAYGIFHAGWTTYLRVRIVDLAGGPDAAPDEAARLEEDTAEIQAAFDAAADGTGTPYLAAYPGRAWPVDSVVAAAALARHDLLLDEDTHAATLETWSAAVDDRLDERTGLIPHAVDAETGMPTDRARGSSQALLLRFLPDIDPDRAAQDHRTFRAEFRSGHSWAPGVREFPVGIDLPGDVDSGPLIAGLSASASAVALGDAVAYGDERAAAALSGLAAPLGLAFGIEERRYLGGLVPVGDAFLVWSLTAGGDRAAPVPSPDEGAAEPPASWWRLPWQVLGAAVLALLWWATWRHWSQRSPRSGIVAIQE